MSIIHLPTRAEEIDDKIYDYFVRPTQRYYSTLLSNKTTIIVGGRGTGKTMLLKSLALNYMLRDASVYETHKDNLYIGCYLRADNRITSSFKGRGMTDEEWIDAFQHYFNLVVTQSINKTLCNLQQHARIHEDCITAYCNRFKEITGETISKNTLEEIGTLVQQMLDSFVRYINNPHRIQKPIIISNGYLFTELCSTLVNFEYFSNRTFFILLDEYENIPENIQRVVNTLIKSNLRPVIFKIAMKHGGWWTKETLSPTESLDLIADYDVIDFEDMDAKEYTDFISRLSDRLLKNAGIKTPLDLSKLFPELSLEEEAANIFANSTKKHDFILNIEEYIRSSIEPAQQDEVRNVLILTDNPLITRVHLILLDRGINAKYLFDVITENKKKYTEWCHHNKTGAMYLFAAEYRTSKKYTGFNTFLSLSSGIVRTFLSLLSTTLEQAIINEFNPEAPRPFHFEEQNHAAYRISRNKIDEIEGYPSCGSGLYAMVHVLGRLFEQLNKSRLQSQPEINHFSIKGDLSAESIERINSAILFSVFQTSDASKLRERSDTKTKDYLLNRIYCPRYGLSYRKMHKLELSAEDFLTISCGTDEERKTFIRTKLKEQASNECSQLSMFDKEDSDA